MGDRLFNRNKKSLLLYHLRYCNGICLNLYLKIVRKTSHKLEIHIYSHIFENWVHFFRLNILKFQDIYNIAKKSQKLIDDKNLFLLKFNKKYVRYILQTHLAEIKTSN